MIAFEIKKIPSYIGFISIVLKLVLVNWLYVITCKKCGYISFEKLPQLKAKEMVRSHLGRRESRTRRRVKLVKVINEETANQFPKQDEH
jgi:predicted nucleic-acid-binding Zn-ribbon protein